MHHRVLTPRMLLRAMCVATLLASSGMLLAVTCSTQCAVRSVFLEDSANGQSCLAFKVNDCNLCAGAGGNCTADHGGSCEEGSTPQQVASCTASLVCPLNPGGSAQASLIEITGGWLNFGNAYVCFL